VKFQPAITPRTKRFKILFPHVCAVRLSSGAFQPDLCSVTIRAESSKFTGEQNFMARGYEQPATVLADSSRKIPVHKASAPMCFSPTAKSVGTLRGGGSGVLAVICFTPFRDFYVTSGP
jgi:hypothetical protein